MMADDPVKSAIATVEAKVRNLEKRMENMKSTEKEYSKSKHKNRKEKEGGTKSELENELLETAKDLRKQIEALKLSCDNKEANRMNGSVTLEDKKLPVFKNEISNSQDSKSLDDNVRAKVVIPKTEIIHRKQREFRKMSENESSENFNLIPVAQDSAEQVADMESSCFEKKERTIISVSDDYQSLAKRKSPIKGELDGLEPAVWKLMKSNKYFDAHFKVKRGQNTRDFSAHKLILSIWSPVLAESLSNENNIEIDDIYPESFEIVLKFLYGSSSEVKKNSHNVKVILDVHKTAEKYKIKKLQEDCYTVLNCTPACEKNVFELFEASNLMNLENLKLRCVNILESKTSMVIASYDVENVTASMIKTILTLPKLSLASENELLAWVFEWAENEYKTAIINDNSILKLNIIDQFLPYLDFAALKAKEFATLMHKHKGFFDEKVCFSIFMNILLPGTVDLPTWHSKTAIRSYRARKSFSEIVGQKNDKENRLIRSVVCSTEVKPSVVKESNIVELPSVEDANEFKLCPSETLQCDSFIEDIDDGLLWKTVKTKRQKLKKKEK